jgi:phosphate-selective porin
MQPEYDYTFNDENENAFKFKRARVGVRGEIYKDFHYYLQVETSPFINGSGSVELLDAFVSYRKFNWAKMSVGSFKQPFSLEVTTPCHGLTTIDRAIVLDQLVSPQRDYGLMVFGGNKFTRFNYAVALMNGSGLNTTDNNSKKDFIARATYKVFDFMTVGGSFRYGYPNTKDDSRTTVGAELLVEYDKFKFQGEYVYDEGDYNQAVSGGCGDPIGALGEKRDGAYAMLTYDTKWNIQPVFKYEYFDSDLDVKKVGYQEMMTIGVNYFIGKNVRFQLNYQAHIETDINIDNDKLLAQVQVRF